MAIFQINLAEGGAVYIQADTHWEKGSRGTKGWTIHFVNDPHGPNHREVASYLMDKIQGWTDVSALVVVQKPAQSPPPDKVLGFKPT